MDLVINGIYKHFKGNLYKVLCVAYDSDTLKEKVVYKALYGDFKIYVRDKLEFLSEVDKNKYPQVMQKYRFEFVKLGDDLND